VQSLHYRRAIDSALDYASAGLDANPPRPEQSVTDTLPQDIASVDSMVWAQIASIERKWVIETIHQGAYLRRYHLWEKECKQYFSAQGFEIPRFLPRHSGTPMRFTEFVEKKVLSEHFSLTVPDGVMAAIDTMRGKVNNMKHEFGVNADVTADEYEVAITAIEKFWAFLGDSEKVMK
jgi:hypothetical protein